MKMKLLALLPLLGMVAHAQDVTEPPANAKARYTVLGVGLQIYACAEDGKWVLQEPQADLIDIQTHQAVGKHTKGPTWTWSDGSVVTGKVLQQRPSADTIPWLLLEAHNSGATGALSGVTFVRRSNTQGGVPQAANICGAQNVGSTINVPYQATYTFYTAQ
jgi:hypothetical protein